MTLTIERLVKVAPGAARNGAAIVAALNPAMDRFGITTKLRACHFIAQLAVESGEFTRKRENLNYQPHAILSTFNTAKVQRFTPAQAEMYGRTKDHPANQEMIANIAYANRMGNGDIKSGDGWRNRGAGWLQLTGADNLNACADYFDIPRDTVHAWLCTPTGAAMGAAWFWHVNGINRFADVDDVDGTSDCVNIGRKTIKVGDAHGYSERRILTDIARGAWA